MSRVLKNEMGYIFKLKYALLYHFANVQSVQEICKNINEDEYTVSYNGSCVHVIPKSPSILHYNKLNDIYNMIENKYVIDFILKNIDVINNRISQLPKSGEEDLVLSKDDDFTGVGKYLIQHNIIKTPDLNNQELFMEFF